ncbi:MAG TPA: BON domain-containing protein [Chitinophagaceae bacterium]|nr:BON domain-containing protein [Chitinophagaceae bacterium]
MKTNEQLQRDVQDAIKWEPLLQAAEIGVIVKEGVVTLTGVVDSYIKKIEADSAAKNVAGVIAVIEQIEVVFSEERPVKTDAEIAKEALHAIQWNNELPANKIQISVENGWVTLEGQLQRNDQKKSLHNAIKNLPGIRGVTNNIEIPEDSASEVNREAIGDALRRNSALHKMHVNVEVHNTKVILSGVVDSLFLKAEAERIAWNAPGVTAIVNNLTVNYVQGNAG